MTHREELLEQLKKIQLEWFRSAANLDAIIRDIELSLDEAENDDMARFFIRCQRNFRADFAKNFGWDEIFKLENVVWQQLIETKEGS